MSLRSELLGANAGSVNSVVWGITPEIQNVDTKANIFAPVRIWFWIPSI